MQDQQVQRLQPHADSLSLPVSCRLFPKVVNRPRSRFEILGRQEDIASRARALFFLLAQIWGLGRPALAIAIEEEVMQWARGWR